MAETPVHPAAPTDQSTTVPADTHSRSEIPSNPPTLDPNDPTLTAFATRIYNAARWGDLPLFQQALPAGLPPNLTNDKGDTIVMLACYHGHHDLAKLLLGYGADPNVLNDRGQSPLAGVVFKHEEDIVKLLLEWGADPDLGTPSAEESVRMFKLEGSWAEEFENARRKIREKRQKGGDDGAGSGERTRGTKAGIQMM